jgi:hypothetical protein
MRIEEADWIARQLKALPDISPVLELGSSTLEFRTLRRPHIDEKIHAPLRARGVRIIHADYKGGDGIDIAGDIFDPRVQEKFRQAGPRALLCCNLFEHVADRAALAKLCGELLPAGGYLIFSGPYSYPYHPDPIDNYFRPTPEEVAALFPEFDVVSADIVRSPGWGAETIRKPLRLPYVLLQRLYCLSKFWIGGQSYRAANHTLLWLFRPYKISCVVMRKRPAA